jgi:hypothetical protein
MADKTEEAYGRNRTKFDNQLKIGKLDRMIVQPHIMISFSKKSIHHELKEVPVVENKAGFEGRFLITQKALAAGRWAALGIVLHWIKPIADLIHDEQFPALNNLDNPKKYCRSFPKVPFQLVFQVYCTCLIFGGFYNHACLF